MEFDPVTLTLDEMMQMDPLALHHLAKKTAGTLTRYRALLGRLILAIERTGAYLDYGCSGGIHYAIMQLGLPLKQAQLLVRVARELECLPLLRYLADNGDIEWSKLREIVRVATSDTERRWAELCRDHTYAQIEDLVSRSLRGEIPPDRPVATRPRSELRCHFDPDQMATLERGLQVMCQATGRALSMAEAIEFLFAEKIAGHQVEDEELEKVRGEALKDLHWTDLINAETEACPDHPEIEIVNPKSRVPTRAQRRKILRRDGYQCAVPGCPNSLWLDLHHIIYHTAGGLTRADNLITLCTRCHKNVHENRLTITGSAPRGLRFLNQFGKDIRHERTLDVAFWLDLWCGWRGSENDARYPRLKACA